MKLAINYSETAQSLFEEGQIHIDLFKCADLPELINKASKSLPVTVHYNLSAGNLTLPSTDWNNVRRLFQTTKTLYINLHLEPRSLEHPDIPFDSIDPYHLTRLTQRIITEIQPVLKRYPEEQIIFENAIYRGEAGGVLRAAVEPDIFHRLMREINCGLLLDISHARISARHLGMDEREYISNLPVHLLKEIHFTGLHNIDGKWVDHLPILEDDWPILEWVFSKIESNEFSRPWLMVFEYGGVGEKYIHRSDPEVIASQIPKISRMMNPLNQ